MTAMVLFMEGRSYDRRVISSTPPGIKCMNEDVSMEALRETSEKGHERGWVKGRT